MPIVPPEAIAAGVTLAMIACRCANQRRSVAHLTFLLLVGDTVHRGAAVRVAKV
jgi:hypothetical protein